LARDFRAFVHGWRAENGKVALGYPVTMISQKMRRFGVTVD
jgi:hypothetical protein